jgi:hypothetical protein
MLIFDQTVACTGMTLAAAKAASFEAKTAFYEGNYRPDFMPTTTKSASNSCMINKREKY